MLTRQKARSEKPAAARETGHRMILLGWVITMIGIVGYVVTMSRAPESSGVIDALSSQGLFGWASLLVLAAGVIVWVIGSVMMLTDVMETPNSDGTGE